MSSWNGRVYVDEEQITPQQYKEFFDRGKFVISFNTANSILRNRAEGYLEEVVPADELIKSAKEDIIEQILDTRETSGEIESEGEVLHYDWDYEICLDKCDADEANGKCGYVSIEDLSSGTLLGILMQMLIGECRCGTW